MNFPRTLKRSSQLKIIKPGFNFILSERAAHPEGENELYAKWQQSQYMHSMFSAHNETLDNQRYNDLKWSKLEEYLQKKAIASNKY